MSPKDDQKRGVVYQEGDNPKIREADKRGQKRSKGHKCGEGTISVLFILGSKAL